MSCQLKLLSSFQDVPTLKKFLFPHVKQGDTADQDALEGWDDADWGWKEDDDQGASENDAPQETRLSWLQNCHVSLSPTADFLAVASEEKLVLLALKWDPQEKSDMQSKFAVVFEGNVTTDGGIVHDVVAFRSSKVKCQTREQVTSVLCLPLASQKRSTHGGPDWTCIIVGYNTGYVRMYTENGTLLLSQIFSEEPVVAIKCRTYEPPRHAADAEKHEELAILYKRALVTIDGFSFFQSLRACRNQVARAAASGGEHIQPPPLAYKKWALQDQEQVNDHISCGMVTPNPFDQMQTGSMLGGYSASIKATPPASHLYLSAGVQPYAGFFYAIEGSAQPMLSDVAHAVASKLKSALFSQISAASGWFGLGGKQQQDNHKERKRPKIEPAAALPARFGLRDQRRAGESIVLSPDNRLAATTDSFGRVMLIDIMQGVAIRMWKGYRDAQVGWVAVKEDTHHERGHPRPEARHALFLIIYAPRRGILEVWTAQQGPRVAAFNVSKWCHLLCPSYGILGLNNVTYKDTRASVHQCYLIDPEGTIKVIEVPFHLALSDKNSKRARDLHLLKKLKLMLKETSEESGSLQTEVIDTLLDMKIPSIRQQGVERVLHTKYLSTGMLQSVVKAVGDQLDKQAQECLQASGGRLDFESRLLLQFCKAQEQLINVHSHLCKLNLRQDCSAEVGDVLEASTKTLSLTSEEVQSLSSQLENYQNSLDSTLHVKFEESSAMSVVDFLNCFECHLVREDKSNDHTETEKSGSTMHVKIQSSLSESRYSRLGNFLFRQSLESGAPADFSIVLTDSTIPPDNLLALLLHLWLSSEKRSLGEAVHLYGLIRCISNLKDACEVNMDHNQVSPWWQKMRDRCLQSEAIGSALLAALVGRSVATDISPKTSQKRPLSLQAEQSVMTSSTTSTDSGRVDLSEWESVTMDRTQWTVLVKQLEDLLALQCLLKLKPPKPEAAATPTGADMEAITVSVKKVLDGGKGVLPELVAKWIAGHGIFPSMLCLSEEAESEDVSTAEKGKEITEDQRSEPTNPIISQLQAVQQRLPHSLDADVLMANCAWEYLLTWNKDTEVIFPLQQALAYLQCIQNAVLQHGVASMMWHMFVVKKLSAAAYLVEKVGKAPKERLCRRDVGMSDVSMEKFLGVTVDLIDTIIQASRDVSEVPMLNIEDLWQSVSGPTSLAELAVEQKDTNLELAIHHLHLCAILHAVMAFGMKSVKPLSLFDTKGRNAFFKPLQSLPILPSRVVDDSIAKTRREFLCRVMTCAVQSLGNRPPRSAPSSPSSPGSPPKLSPPSSPGLRSPIYSHWPPLVLRVARDLPVDMDIVRRHHVYELYSSGFDKLAEEVLLTVSDHSVMGSQLILIAGQRLHHFVFTCDTLGNVEKLAKCPPTVSTWLKTQDPDQLRCPDPQLKDTAALIGQAVNQLPESHSEYNMAISLVDLVQSFM